MRQMNPKSGLFDAVASDLAWRLRFRRPVAAGLHLQIHLAHSPPCAAVLAARDQNRQEPQDVDARLRCSARAIRPVRALARPTAPEAARAQTRPVAQTQASSASVVKSSSQCFAPSAESGLCLRLRREIKYPFVQR